MPTTYYEQELHWDSSFLQGHLHLHSFMRYHGIWDLNELYDIQKDPDQTNNLLAHVRTTTEGGRLFNRIKDPDLKELIRGFEERIRKTLEMTGGRMEPIWRR